MTNARIRITDGERNFRITEVNLGSPDDLTAAWHVAAVGSLVMSQKLATENIDSNRPVHGVVEYVPVESVEA